MTDKQIRKAAAHGVDNLLELREELGVASCCGSCADAAEEILLESASRPAMPRLYVPATA